MKPIANVENVLIKAAKGIPFELDLKAALSLYDDFEYDSLHAQLLVLRNVFKEADPVSVSDICATLNATEGTSQLLNEVARFIQLVLVVPANSASAERSFSTLRRLKTYLRSTVGQPRLNHLMLLNIHKQRLDNIDMQEVAQDFINACETRSQYFDMF